LRKISSILLVFLISLNFLPVQLLCLAHPFGHKAHEHDIPSPCELRAEWNGNEDALFPPMHCNHFEIDQDLFEKPNTNISGLNNLLLVYFVPNIDEGQEITSPFFIQPDPKGNSDPPLKRYLLRGPPTA